MITNVWWGKKTCTGGKKMLLGHTTDEITHLEKPWKKVMWHKECDQTAVESAVLEWTKTVHSRTYCFRPAIPPLARYATRCSRPQDRDRYMQDAKGGGTFSVWASGHLALSGGTYQMCLSGQACDKWAWTAPRLGQMSHLIATKAILSFLPWYLLLHCSLVLWPFTFHSPLPNIAEVYVTKFYF